MILTLLVFRFAFAAWSWELLMEQAKRVDKYREMKPMLTKASRANLDKNQEVREWLRRIEFRASQVQELHDHYMQNSEYYSREENNHQYVEILESIRKLATEQQLDLAKIEEMYDRVLLRLIKE